MKLVLNLKIEFEFLWHVCQLLQLDLWKYLKSCHTRIMCKSPRSYSTYINVVFSTSILDPQLFPKKQNMQCGAIERMQVVVYYCDRYATKIRVYRSLSRLRFALKTGKLTLQKLATSLNEHKTFTKWPNKLNLDPREAEWPALGGS